MTLLRVPLTSALGVSGALLRFSLPANCSTEKVVPEPAAASELDAAAPLPVRAGAATDATSPLPIRAGAANATGPAQRKGLSTLMSVKMKGDWHPMHTV
eukprot:2024876-Heterocapsa_arctica.AAC.1